jgi:hypothetical protein
MRTTSGLRVNFTSAGSMPGGSFTALSPETPLSGLPSTGRPVSFSQNFPIRTGTCRGSAWPAAKTPGPPKKATLAE